jgi:hypothetical protein
MWNGDCSSSASGGCHEMVIQLDDRASGLSCAMTFVETSIVCAETWIGEANETLIGGCHGRGHGGRMATGTGHALLALLRGYAPPQQSVACLL